MTDTMSDIADIPVTLDPYGFVSDDAPILE